MTGADHAALTQIPKVETGIPGFEFIAEGGLPQGRTTLVSGAPGTGKTIFAAQFLAQGIARGENGVFITFEETPAGIRANLAGLGWDLPAWETAGQWRFVDASPSDAGEGTETGAYDLSALIARIENAVTQVGAQRVAIDSLAAILPRFGDTTVLRRELYRMTMRLKALGVTTILTGERTGDQTGDADFGVEEFVIDAVVLLRNVLDGEKRRRTLEILKMRGASHRHGEYPFTVVSGQGISVVPLAAVELNRTASSQRVTIGNEALDRMMDGGLLEGSVVLVSGGTGTGKTLLGTQFLAGGARHGERGLLLSFEEGESQFVRNAASWGIDLQGLIDEDRIRVLAHYPETAGLEAHLITIKNLIDRYQPGRVVLDSLSALERIGSRVGFKHFVVALTAYLKAQGITALYTAASPNLAGGGSASESQVSTITDAIILMRYVETPGAVGRALTILKMRGSQHDRSVRHFDIDDTGLHIGAAYTDVTGLMSGSPGDDRTL